LTSASERQGDATRSDAGRRLCALAVLTLTAALPVAMAFANRSSPLLLSVAAALAVAAAWIERGPGALGASFSRLLRTPEAWAAAAFLAWALASVTWSVDRRLSLATLGEFVIPIAAAIALAAALPDRLPRWAPLALAAALVVVSILVAVEVRLDFPLRRLWGGRIESFVMNRPIVTAVVLFWPLAAALRAQRRSALAAGVFLCVAAAAVMSTSGSSKLGVIAGAAVYGLALAAPRVVARAGVALLVIVVAAQPWFGELADRAIPQRGFEALKAAHARERVDIWLAFGEVARLRPLTGTGFGSSARVEADPVAAQVPAERREMLGVGHPHDAPLQVWTELGAPGALLALALCGLLARRFSGMPVCVLPERLAFFAAAMAVALESHGAWQGWWITAVAVPVVLFSRPPDADREADR
jgi:O-antigen ligase